MFKNILTIVAMILVITVVGSVLLDQFPTLQPIWNEFKEVVGSFYESSKVKYGVLTTVIFIVGIGILFASSTIK
ncbi:hypothetical protein SAMN05880501_11316 [Ureibacillus xyleni]|uniref:Uncharacterized protein n=1 Tax=Ureibacillus xyleni TaxID=614648 RepID=A0A285TLG8_9BACL|nr:hypothetical protein [Ureibacillus xyleni]SOC21556.1 hypothetical protein SAMN05880501_11316 [Ureibacillus xyleni]